MKDYLEKAPFTFFSEMILLVLLLSALIISISKRKAHKSLEKFPLYIIFFILVIAVGNLKLRTGAFNYDDYLDYFFTLIELLIFIDYFYHVIQNKLYKKTLILTSAIFSIFFIYNLISDSSFPKSISDVTQSRVYTIEAIMLLFSCFVYFFEFNYDVHWRYNKGVASLLIVIGLTLFSLITLPYSISENSLIQASNTGMELYSFFNIFYIIFFILLIKAYLCKSQKMM